MSCNHPRSHVIQIEEPIVYDFCGSEPAGGPEVYARWCSRCGALQQWTGARWRWCQPSKQ